MRIVFLHALYRARLFIIGLGILVGQGNLRNLVANLVPVVTRRRYREYLVQDVV